MLEMVFRLTKLCSTIGAQVAGLQQQLAHVELERDTARAEAASSIATGKDVSILETSLIQAKDVAAQKEQRVMDIKHELSTSTASKYKINAAPLFCWRQQF